MALQKYRVICPYCESILLVTEDLLGQPGTCPGCQQEFQLPGIESFSPAEAVSPASPAGSGTASSQRPVPPPVAPVSPPFPASAPAVPSLPREAPRSSGPNKPVRMEGRPALRLLAGLMKVLAGVQVAAGCLLLVVLVVLASRSPMPPQLVLILVGMALTIGMGAIPMLAFSELILVFIAQEEMLRHLVNHHREKDAGP